MAVLYSSAFIVKGVNSEPPSIIVMGFKLGAAFKNFPRPSLLILLDNIGSSGIPIY